MEAVVARVVEMLARGDYGPGSTGWWPRADWGELKAVLERYDVRVVMPPPDAFAELDSYKIAGTTEYNVDFDLWLEGQGRSQLTLQLWMKLSGNREDVRVPDLRFL